MAASEILQIRETTVSRKDGRWPRLRLPDMRPGAYAPTMSDNQFLVSILAIGALTLLLVGVALFYS
jgi:hypothetical protein